MSFQEEETRDVGEQPGVDGVSLAGNAPHERDGLSQNPREHGLVDDTGPCPREKTGLWF